ncbi:MAG: type II toxin-antitoxin system VapC family toxin [Chloroflexi bacterium]|nr:type II toxin-antitoxin system VapC family toxin [Chloroflexota bacterium]
MPVVVDANVLVVLASGDPRKPAAQALIRGWIETGQEMHAPTLLLYEVASGLTRLVAAGAFPVERIAEAWQTVVALPITYHPLQADGDQVVTIALRLGRQSAYDAAYLALARRLGAALWTFDGPLARNAVGYGFPVHLITPLLEAHLMTLGRLPWQPMSGTIDVTIPGRRF